MRTLRVSLFGKMGVSWAGCQDHDCGSAKARELFAYLLLHRDRAHPRERLGSLLWDHLSTERSKAYLRKALWQLQRAFDEEVLSEASAGDPAREASGDFVPLLVVDGAWVQINAWARVWLDVEVFESAFQAVRDRDVADLTPPEAEALQRAVSLYTSDLLENWYLDWCLLERERLQDMYLMALGKLAHYAELHGSYDTGIAYGLLMLQVDPARETAHRRLMRMRYLSGDRTGALRQYARCAEVLDAELGVQPSTATRQLLDQVRTDTLRLEPDLPERRARGSSLHGGIDRLRDLQRTLAALQSQVRREIEAVEVAIQKHC